MRNISWLDGRTRFERERVGRKALALQELRDMGLAIPRTFVVSSEAGIQFLMEANIRSRLVRLTDGIGDLDEYGLRSRAEEAVAMVLEARIPWDMEIDLVDAYKRLSHEAGVVEEDFALRPSVHLPGSSDTGLEERISSLFNLKGEPSLLEGVKELWSQTLSRDSLQYLRKKRLSWADLRFGIIVQPVVAAEASGRITTLDPVYGKEAVVVRAVLGLGAPLADRELSGDSYIVDRSDLTVRDRMVADQMWMSAKGHRDADGVPMRKDVEVFQQSRPKITDALAGELARMALDVERSAREPVELDYCVDDTGIYVTDYRTVSSQEVLRVPPESPPSARPVGAAAYPDASLPRSAAPAHSSSSSDGARPWDMFSMAPAAEEAAGEKSGTDPFSSPRPSFGSSAPGPEASSRAHGQPSGPPEPADVPTPSSGPGAGTDMPGTRVLLALDGWDHAEKMEDAAVLSSDGIGVLAMDGVWLRRIRSHPLQVISQGREESAVEVLRKAMTGAGRAFGNRPVLVKPLARDPGIMYEMPGGPSHEEQDLNPELGLRGAARLVHPEYRRAARLGLRALSQARNRDGRHNLHLTVPCVRNAEEMEALGSLLSAEGLARDAGLGLYAIIETPSGVHAVPELGKSCDGIVLDIPRLSACILGIASPEGPFSAPYYMPQGNPALAEALEYAIGTARVFGMNSFVTGMAPDDDLLIDSCVGLGATAVVARPDELDRMRTAVSRSERRFLMDRLRCMEEPADLDEDDEDDY